MRARRSSVSGCASGSASAAAWTSSSVSASKRLQSCFPVFFMVSASLIGFGLAGGDDPNFLAAHRVAHEQQAALHHANHAVAFLIVVLLQVLPFNRERVAEHLARLFEGDGMVAPVPGGLVIIPREILVFHKIRDTRSFCKCTGFTGMTVTVRSTFFGRLRRAAMASSRAW